MGLVPVKRAAEFVFLTRDYLLEGRRPDLKLTRVEIGGLVRYGINAREVLKVSPDEHARRKLARALAVWNGTEAFGGRPRAFFSVDEDGFIISMRSSDASRWSWSKLADELNKQRDPADPDRSRRPLSYGTVRRRFLELTAAQAG